MTTTNSSLLICRPFGMGVGWCQKHPLDFFFLLSEPMHNSLANIRNEVISHSRVYCEEEFFEIVSPIANEAGRKVTFIKSVSALRNSYLPKTKHLYLISGSAEAAFFSKFWTQDRNDFKILVSQSETRRDPNLLSFAGKVMHVSDYLSTMPDQLENTILISPTDSSKEFDLVLKAGATYPSFTSLVISSVVPEKKLSNDGVVQGAKSSVQPDKADLYFRADDVHLLQTVAFPSASSATKYIQPKLLSILDDIGNRQLTNPSFFRGIGNTSSSSKASICIVMKTIPGPSVGGGRQHAILMALAFAAAGHSTTILTDNPPQSLRQHGGTEGFDNLTLIVDKKLNLNSPGTLSPDWVICVPGVDEGVSVYDAAISISEGSTSKLALISFETPNWFNLLSPKEKSEALWSGWKKVAAKSNMVICSNDVALAFAKEFYETGPDTEYVSIQPSVFADETHFSGSLEKQDFIFMPMRFTNEGHKGSELIFHIFDSRFSGIKIVIMTNQFPKNLSFINRFREHCDSVGITLEVVQAITEAEKWVFYRTAKVTAFPSTFEGFGLPPVESVISGTRCVVFDLPVYQETVGDYLDVVSKWDADAFANRLLSLHAREVPLPENDLRGLRNYYSLKRFSEELSKLVQIPKNPSVLVSSPSLHKKRTPLISQDLKYRMIARISTSLYSFPKMHKIAKWVLVFFERRKSAK